MHRDGLGGGGGRKDASECGGGRCVTTASTRRGGRRRLPRPPHRCGWDADFRGHGRAWGEHAAPGGGAVEGARPARGRRKRRLWRGDPPTRQWAIAGRGGVAPAGPPRVRRCGGLEPTTVLLAAGTRPPLVGAPAAFQRWHCNHPLAEKRAVWLWWSKGAPHAARLCKVS